MHDSVENPEIVSSELEERTCISSGTLIPQKSDQNGQALLNHLEARRPVKTAAVANVLEAVAPVSPTRVVAGGRGELRFFDAREMTRFWASDKYTLFRADGEEHLTEEPLVTLALRLTPA